MKDTYDQTIPVNPSQKRELKEQLDWLVFKKEKFPVKQTKITFNDEKEGGK